MNFEQLKHIITVAQTGSLLSASKKLHITQSALSQSISRLEHILGVKIFIRSRLGTRPTSTGREIIEKASEILEKRKELEMIVHTKAPEQLTICIVPSLLKFMSEMLMTFKINYPYVHLDVLEAVEDLQDQIIDDKVDIGIEFICLDQAQNKYDKTITCHTLARSNLIVVVNKKSPLAQTKLITPEKLIRYPLILYNKNFIWKFIKDLQSQNLSVNISLTSNNLELIYKAVSENLGVTIITEYTYNTYFARNDNLVSKKFAKLEQEYGLVMLYSDATLVSWTHLS